MKCKKSETCKYKLAAYEHNRKSMLVITKMVQTEKFMWNFTSPAADMYVIKQAIAPLCPPVYLRTSWKDQTAQFNLQ